MESGKLNLDMNQNQRCFTTHL